MGKLVQGTVPSGLSSGFRPQLPQWLRKTHTVHGDWQSQDQRGLLPRIAEGAVWQRMDRSELMYITDQMANSSTSPKMLQCLSTMGNHCSLRLAQFLDSFRHFLGFLTIFAYHPSLQILFGCFEAELA